MDTEYFKDIHLALENELFSSINKPDEYPGKECEWTEAEEVYDGLLLPALTAGGHCRELLF
jgi:hypothetical protein